MRWLGSAAAAGLTALALAGPVQAQDPEPYSEHFMLQEANPRRSTLKTGLLNLGSAAINSLGTGLLAWYEGAPFWDGVKKSLPIHTGLAVIRTADYAAAGSDWGDNPLPNLAGEISAQLIDNIVEQAPLCNDLSLTYNTLTTTYDCGDWSMEWNWEELLPSAALLGVGMRLDLEMTLAYGAPVIRYTEEQARRFPRLSRVVEREGRRYNPKSGETTFYPYSDTLYTNGFSVFGVLAVIEHDEPEAIAQAKRYLRERPPTRAHDLEARDALADLVIQRERRARARTQEVLDHEIRHRNQYHLLDRVSEDGDALGWTRPRITVAGKDFGLPLLELIAVGLEHSSTGLYPYLPWELTANINDSGPVVHNGPTSISFGQSVGGETYYVLFQRQTLKNDF